MGKKSKGLALNYSNDKYIYILTLISIFIISLTIRVKEVGGYLNYNRQDIIQGLVNLETYLKLIFLLVLVSGVCIFFLYDRLSKKLPFRKDYVLIGIGAIIVSSGIATALSEIKYVAIMGFYSRNNGLLAYLSLFLLLYIVSNLKLEDKHIRYTLYTVNILSLIFTVIGVFEFFGHSFTTSQLFKELVVPKIYQNATFTSNVGYYNAASLFLQQNYFGAFCSMFFPLITVFAINSHRIWERLFFAFGSLMLFAGLNTAVSLGPWITVLLILVLLPLLILNKKNLMSFVLLYVGYLLITVFFSRCNNILVVETSGIISGILSSAKLILGFLALLIVVVTGLLLRKRLERFRYKIVVAIILIVVFLSTFGFIYVLENVTPNNMSLLSNRGYVWHYSYQELKSDFLFGFGPDNFPYEFPQNNPDTQLYSAQIVFDKPHNMYLQVWADGGILALVGFVYLLVIFLIKSTRQMFNSSDETTMSYVKAIFLTVVVYMIQGFVNDNHISIQPMLYTVMGVGISLCYYLEKNNCERPELIERK
jgi:hypothetical protein